MKLLALPYFLFPALISREKIIKKIITIKAIIAGGQRSIISSNSNLLLIAGIFIFYFFKRFNALESLPAKPFLNTLDLINGYFRYVDLPLLTIYPLFPQG
jgi:hypothetical protein